MKILFALVLVGLFETMVAVPKNLANPRPQSSDLDCEEGRALEEGTNEFAICEAFEIAETGDFDNSETGDGNGDELMKIFDDSYIFRANWETDRWGKMINLTKNDVQEQAFDFMGDISGFNADDNEDVFVVIDSQTITTKPDGSMEADGDWKIELKGSKDWKGTWKMTAKDGKIISEYVEADQDTLDAILAIDFKMKRGIYAIKN